MRYWIGLGSNLGDRLATLRSAAVALADLGSVVKRSRVWAASPVGGPPQPPFLNAAVLLDAELAPLDLLAACLRIETGHGRVRPESVRWGPRTLDVDLLLAGARGELIVNEPDLTLPHPRVGERGFALGPLCDLDATLVHPQLGRPLTSLLTACNDSTQALAPTGELLI